MPTLKVNAKYRYDDVPNYVFTVVGYHCSATPTGQSKYSHYAVRCKQWAEVRLLEIEAVDHFIARGEIVVIENGDNGLTRLLKVFKNSITIL